MYSQTITSSITASLLLTTTLSAMEQPPIDMVIERPDQSLIRLTRCLSLAGHDVPTSLMLQRVPPHGTAQTIRIFGRAHTEKLKTSELAIIYGNLLSGRLSPCSRFVAITTDGEGVNRAIREEKHITTALDVDATLARQYSALAFCHEPASYVRFLDQTLSRKLGICFQSFWNSIVLLRQRERPPCYTGVPFTICEPQTAHSSFRIEDEATCQRFDQVLGITAEERVCT